MTRPRHMLAKHDLIGQRFGNVVALQHKGHKRGCRETLWLCECDCGRRFTTQRTALVQGRCQSCHIGGCAKRRRMIEARTKPVELPLIKVRYQNMAETKARPATKVPCKLQVPFANDKYVRKHQGRLTLSGDARDEGQAHPFVKPEESVWIRYAK